MNVQLTQTETGVEIYGDIDDAGSRLPVVLDAPGDHHRPRGPDTSFEREPPINLFVQGSVDSGRDGDPATDGAASRTTAQNFTIGAQRGALSTSATSGRQSKVK